MINEEKNVVLTVIRWTYFSFSSFIFCHPHLYITIYIHFLSSTFIYYHLYSFSVIHIHILPSLFICCHPHSYITIYIHLLSSTFIYYNLYSFIVIHISIHSPPPFEPMDELFLWTRVSNATVSVANVENAHHSTRSEIFKQKNLKKIEISVDLQISKIFNIYVNGEFL